MRRLGFLPLLLSVSFVLPAPADTNLPVSVQGGWNHERWRELSATCADKILDTVADRYGPVQTPLWLGIVDPATGGLLQNKPPNWQNDWDAEDYVVTAHGCNLYRDMPTLAAFYELTRLTSNDKYRNAADAYLTFFMGNMPSKTTGLFPWGEHMSYDLVRDRITATRHEMERNLPEWEMLWSIDPNAVTKEIEAVRRISIYDNDNYLFDRHANYYTGEFDPLPVRGPYIKHTGLFAHSFLYLYSKTKNPAHLEWAQKISDLYWRNRNPQTNLLPGVVYASGGSGPSASQLTLAYYLLSALSFHDDPYIRERALGMVDSYLKYGYDAETATFAAALDPATGNVTIPGPSLWSIGESADAYHVLACLKACEVSSDKHYLAPAVAVLLRLNEVEPTESVGPELAALWLDAYLTAFDLTSDERILQGARKLAEWTASHLVRDAYILEAANGYVYQAKARPGALLQAWLRLYQIESRREFRWTAPDHVVPGSVLSVEAISTGPSPVAKMAWKAPSGSSGVVDGTKNGQDLRFALTIEPGMGQGYLDLHFLDANDRAIGTGTVLLAENPKGPEVGDWVLPEWVDRDAALQGRVQVNDSSGVVSAAIHYRFGAEPVATVLAQSVDNHWYSFTLPPAAQAAGDVVSIWCEAAGNPGFPIRVTSDTRRVALANHVDLSITGDAGVSRNEEVPGWNINARCELSHKLDGAVLGLDRLSVNPQRADGLPSKVLSSFFAARPDPSMREGANVWLEYAIDAHSALEVLPSTIGAYQWSCEVWQRVSRQDFDAKSGRGSFLTSGDGLFVVAGETRQMWRRTFNGALLSSPAVARVSNDGTLAIILDTRASDGMLYALNAKGETLWTYDMDAPQPFVAVADVNGDNLDEIAVGGADLVLLNHDGTPRWKTGIPNVGAPIIGDIDGNGGVDIAAATRDGRVVVFTSEGQAVWQAANVASGLTIPALGAIGSGKGLNILVAGDGKCVAIAPTGAVLWQTAIPGKAMYGPAVADLNEDGDDDAIVLSRTDTDGTVSAISGRDGALIWSCAVSRQGDWSPVVTSLDAPGEIQVLVQSVDGLSLQLLDRSGRLIRPIPIESRTTTSPVATDLTGDGKQDLLIACNESRRVWAIDNGGDTLWTHTPPSVNLGGTKIKGGGSLLVADIDGDGKIEVVGGDDETWLNAIRTETTCRPWTVLSGQFHGDALHSGRYIGR